MANKNCLRDELIVRLEAEESSCQGKLILYFKMAGKCSHIHQIQELL